MPASDHKDLVGRILERKAWMFNQKETCSLYYLPLSILHMCLYTEMRILKKKSQTNPSIITEEIKFKPFLNGDQNHI